MEDVEALVFDVFGTVVDWHGTVTKELQRRGAKLPGVNVDWAEFASEWRSGYITGTRRVADGGPGPLSVDAMHREILENMLNSPKWASVAVHWDTNERDDLNLIWHHLDGWTDSTKGLYELKKSHIICTLSNGNMRLLIDMAKHADLPWDSVFSGELFGSFKPYVLNPKTYLGVAHHLSLPPSKCAMVAAHKNDLDAAASHGLKTVYVRRPTEDNGIRDQVKSKAEGGDMDVVVDSFLELAAVLGGGKQ